MRLTSDGTSVRWRGVRTPIAATPRRETSGRPVPATFVAAVFAAAALLFFVQPMVGKMVLPRVGGSPQAWNTALVFFQAALLVGYLYAHLSVRVLGVRRQAILHVGVLALPLLVLPIALPETYPPVGTSQSPWVLMALTVAVGMPFVVLAAASPLIQRWLAATDHDAGRDPYFLYAASNAGSLLALLAYPFVLEPLLPVSRQSLLWTVGYLGFAVLAVSCALKAIASMQSGAHPPPLAWGTGRRGRAVGSGDRFFWIASAAVPSALLLGVTQYLTTQIAPFSLLWVLPLAIYLGTYVVAFARRRIVPLEAVSRCMAITAVVIALALLTRTVDPAWAVAILHLGLLATAGLLCHLRLADSRPAVSNLTEFYLLVATGGAIGGLLSGIVAPVVFDTIAEYPIAVAAACLFTLPFARSSNERSIGLAQWTDRALDFALPAVLAVYIAGALWATKATGLADGWVLLLVAVVPTIACFLLSRRPLRFALGIAVLFTTAESGQMFRGGLLLTERTFFGVHRVVRNSQGSTNVLYSGSTVHGVQSTDPARAREPLGYYHPTGPAGSLMSALAAVPEKRSVALVGVGSGALAVLAGSHQHVTLYEIDPVVMQIAEGSGHFTYLANARATLETVLGDGRLRLSRSEERYDLIVLDAFSSGNVPSHLLTREAVRTYLDRLAPGGSLLFHVSNRYLDLVPILAAHARDLGLAGWESIDVRNDEATEAGIFSSHWVLLARAGERLGFPTRPRWAPLPSPERQRAWTDDLSNLLSVQRWN